MKTAGIWLTVIGALVLLATVVGGTIAGVIGISNASPDPDRIEEIGGPTTVEVAADEDRLLYIDEGAVEPLCSLTAADGTVHELTLFGQYSSFPHEGRDLTSFASLTEARPGPDPVPGTYALECDSTDVVLAPPVGVGSIFTGALGIIIAVFGGFCGLVLVVLGIVLWAVGAKKTKR